MPLPRWPMAQRAQLQLQTPSSSKRQRSSAWGKFNGNRDAALSLQYAAYPSPLQGSDHDGGNTHKLHDCPADRQPPLDRGSLPLLHFHCHTSGRWAIFDGHLSIPNRLPHDQSQAECFIRCFGRGNYGCRRQDSTICANAPGDAFTIRSHLCICGCHRPYYRNCNGSAP